jgi:hypothetical protein
MHYLPAQALVTASCDRILRLAQVPPRAKRLVGKGQEDEEFWVFVGHKIPLQGKRTCEVRCPFSR